MAESVRSARASEQEEGARAEKNEAGIYIQTSYV